MNRKDIKSLWEAYQSVVSEKAVSQQQQKLMGLALAYKRGEVEADKISPETKAMADKMSEKDLEDFAKTKHKGLPVKKEEAEQVDEGPDYLGDLRRKKEREERKKASQNDGETNRQKTMRKVYGKAMGGLKKEESEKLDEISAKLARKAAAMSVAKGYEYGQGGDDDDELDRLDKKSDKAMAHVKKRQGKKGVRKVGRLANKAIFGRSRAFATEETELEEKTMYVVRYSGPDKKGDSSPMSKDAAEARAKRGNAVDKVGGKYTVVAVNAKGHDVKESVDLQEAASPHAKAAAHLEKMVKDPKFARFYGDDIDDLKSIAKDLKSSNPTDHKNAAKAARNLDTIVRDIVSDAVHKHSSKDASNMWHDHAGMRRLKEEKVECPKCKGEGCDHCDGKGYHQEAMDPVNKKALKKDFDDRKDKDIDNDGDVDGSDEYLHNRRKAVGKAMSKDKKDKQAEISKIGEAFEDLWTAMKEAAEPANRRKNATPPEGLIDKESPKSKEFVAKHEVEVTDEEPTHDTVTAAGRATKPSPTRPGDNKAGDKNIVNPVKSDAQRMREKIMDVLSGKTWKEIKSEANKKD